VRRRGAPPRGGRIPRLSVLRRGPGAGPDRRPDPFPVPAADRAGPGPAAAPTLGRPEAGVGARRARQPAPRVLPLLAVRQGRSAAARSRLVCAGSRMGPPLAARCRATVLRCRAGRGRRGDRSDRPRGGSPGTRAGRRGHGGGGPGTPAGVRGIRWPGRQCRWSSVFRDGHAPETRTPTDEAGADAPPGWSAAGRRCSRPPSRSARSGSPWPPSPC
jgi:hypothetical protein